MPRRALIAVGSVASAGFLLAGCSSKGTIAPVPKTVEGSIPKTTAAPARGNPTAGKAIFLSSGCGGCHTYGPAGSTGQVGPNLDHLAADARRANRGTLEQYTIESIVDPGAYVIPGYLGGTMPTTFGQTLSKKQIADLVAFLTETS